MNTPKTYHSANVKSNFLVSEGLLEEIEESTVTIDDIVNKLYDIDSISCSNIEFLTFYEGTVREEEFQVGIIMLTGDTFILSLDSLGSEHDGNLILHVNSIEL